MPSLPKLSSATMHSAPSSPERSSAVASSSRLVNNGLGGEGNDRGSDNSGASLTKDGFLLLVARFVRLFSYGWLAVGLIMYLVQVGFSQFQIGALFTCTLIGDLIVTFWLTTHADAMGRRTTLLVASLLKVFAGVAYAFTSSFWGLLLAGFIGIVSPTGGEIGPFLSVEQAALTEAVTRKEHIPTIFGYYQLVGFLAQAAGALISGLTIASLQHTHGWSSLAAYRFIIVGYGIFGLIKFVIYFFLSSAVEPLHLREFGAETDSLWSKFGLHHPESRRVVFKLSCLFVIDAVAGGFVMQSIIVYWFHESWQMDEAHLGVLMMVANIFSGLSALAATPLVHKIGAINTMVFTHLPSNILLLLVPFMPTAKTAVIMLLLRFTISQMDVPARQSYVATVVAADERSAAGGITSIVRSVGLSLSPLLAGYLLASPEHKVIFGLPFIIAGGLKCVYDILLYISFKTAKHDEPSAATQQYAQVGVNKEDVMRVEADTNLYESDDEDAHKPMR